VAPEDVDVVVPGMETPSTVQVIDKIWYPLEAVAFRVRVVLRGTVEPSSGYTIAMLSAVSAAVVALAVADCGDRFPAASLAATLYEKVVEGVKPLSWKLVPLTVAI